eukprot:360269-Chlamydomonas_euryale.AAC.6
MQPEVAHPVNCDPPSSSLETSSSEAAQTISDDWLSETVTVAGSTPSRPAVAAKRENPGQLHIPSLPPSSSSCGAEDGIVAWLPSLRRCRCVGLFLLRSDVSSCDKPHSGNVRRWPPPPPPPSPERLVGVRTFSSPCRCCCCSCCCCGGGGDRCGGSKELA